MRAKLRFGVTIVLGLGACSGAGDERSAGTLAYVEAGTEHIRVRDLATGDDAVIDDGLFSGVSLAADGKHVAYEGADGIIKIANRAAMHMAPSPSGGCAGVGTWAANNVLLYCVYTGMYQGTMVLPALDGTPPHLVTGSFAVTHDGTRDVRFAANGDLLAENIDGSMQRVVVPSGGGVTGNVAELTPDDHAVIVADGAKLHIVSLADGAHVDVDDAYFPATPFGTPTIHGASAFSADGGELLVQSSTALVAVSLTSGAKRVIAALPAQVSSGTAAFLDAGHVLWVRVENHNDGDVGHFFLSLHIAGPTPTDDTVLDNPQVDNRYWDALAVSPAGVIALPGNALLVNRTGEVLMPNDLSSDASAVESILGVTPSGDFVTTTIRGDVRLLGVDGTTRDLVTASGGPNGAAGPAAAYVP